MKKNKFVLNHDAFTFMEVIITLFIMLVIMSMLPLIYHAFQAIDQQIEIEEDFEWNLFVIELRTEIAESEEIRVFENNVYLVKRGIRVVYEQYGKTIRRRVNNEGHEVVLQSIERVRFFYLHDTLHVTVTFENGEEDEARYWIGDLESSDKDL